MNELRLTLIFLRCPSWINQSTHGAAWRVIFIARVWCFTFLRGLHCFQQMVIHERAEIYKEHSYHLKPQTAQTRSCSLCYTAIRWQMIIVATIQALLISHIKFPLWNCSEDSCFSLDVSSSSILRWWIQVCTRCFKESDLQHILSLSLSLTHTHTHTHTHARTHTHTHTHDFELLFKFIFHIYINICFLLHLLSLHLFITNSNTCSTYICFMLFCRVSPAIWPDSRADSTSAALCPWRWLALPSAHLGSEPVLLCPI